MINIKRFFNKKIVSVSIVLISLAFLVIFYNLAKSSNQDNVSGYAWSADNWTDLDGDGIHDAGEDTMNPPGGAGWISFNCTTGGNCATDGYGVNIDSASGNLTGFAWSPHFGWLKFGNLSGFPIGGGTTSANAKLTGSNITGWARFCAGASNNSTCLGTVPNSSNGGWDGWVALSGTGYGVTLTINPATGTGDFDGFAWGGNDDSYGNHTVGTGWIDWKTDVGGVVYIPAVTPYVLLHATPTIVAQDATTVLSWEGAGIVAGNNVCTASSSELPPSDSDWATNPNSANRVSPTGSFTTQQLNQLGTHTYTITCPVEGPGGGTVTSSVDVAVGINLYLTADPTSAQYPDYTTQLSWNVVPSTTVFSTCHASVTGNIPNTNWEDPVALPPSFRPNINVPNNPTEYNLTCTTPTGTVVTAHANVARAPIPGPSILLDFNGVVSNGSGGYITDLNWSSEDVVLNSCDGSVEDSTTHAPISGTGWNLQDGNNTDPDYGVVNDVLVPIAPLKYDYILTCGRLGGGTISFVLPLNSASNEQNVRPHYKER